MIGEWVGMMGKGKEGVVERGIWGMMVKMGSIMIGRIGRM
jgi:hypothetical protein